MLLPPKVVLVVELRAQIVNRKPLTAPESIGRTELNGFGRDLPISGLSDFQHQVSLICSFAASPAIGSGLSCRAQLMLRFAATALHATATGPPDS
jgi:hypothetical protein